jgi:hypothetical protein
MSTTVLPASCGGMRANELGRQRLVHARGLTPPPISADDGLRLVQVAVCEKHLPTPASWPAMARPMLPAPMIPTFISVCFRRCTVPGRSEMCLYFVKSFRAARPRSLPRPLYLNPPSSNSSWMTAQSLMQIVTDCTSWATRELNVATTAFAYLILIVRLSLTGGFASMIISILPAGGLSYLLSQRIPQP